MPPEPTHRVSRFETKRTTRNLTFTDSLVIIFWLLGLVGVFGFIGWLCYRLFQITPFVLLPPGVAGL